MVLFLEIPQCGTVQKYHTADTLCSEICLVWALTNLWCSVSLQSGNHPLDVCISNEDPRPYFLLLFFPLCSCFCCEIPPLSRWRANICLRCHGVLKPDHLQRLTGRSKQGRALMHIIHKEHDWREKCARRVPSCSVGTPLPQPLPEFFKSGAWI